MKFFGFFFLFLSLSAHARLGSIGFYSNGCLDSDKMLLGVEAGLSKIFIERDRGYGNPVMIELLTTLGQDYQRQWREALPWQKLERLQIGDVARKGGGALGRHLSHQTGLDADIVYFRNDHRETKPNRGADVNFDESFVKKGTVTPNFDAERNWWALRWVYRTGIVDRIFVDQAIKRYYCENAVEFEPDDHVMRDQILRMLRPYALHDDHFHMRLTCPSKDVQCVSQTPVPPGSGCEEHQLNNQDEEPEYEFEGEGDLLLSAPTRGHHPLPPAACRQLQ